MENRRYIITYKRFDIINMYYKEEKFELITNDINDVYRAMGSIIANSLEEIRYMRYYSVEI